MDKLRNNFSQSDFSDSEPVAGYTNLEDLLIPLVSDFGLALYDIEYPRGNYGTLRILLQKGSQVKSEKLDLGSEATVSSNSINIDDCSRVAHAITHNPLFDRWISDTITLEVSSPGVNRRLKTKLHCEGAIGERVKVKFNLRIKPCFIELPLDSFGNEGGDLGVTQKTIRLDISLGLIYLLKISIHLLRKLPKLKTRKRALIF
jgi:ribosome maturation factor RimP